MDMWEEVNKIFPKLVSKSLNEEGIEQVNGINYRHLVSILVKEIQNLNSRVNTLEDRNITILTRLDALEATP